MRTRRTLPILMGGAAVATVVAVRLARHGYRWLSGVVAASAPEHTGGIRPEQEQGGGRNRPRVTENFRDADPAGRQS